MDSRKRIPDLGIHHDKRESGPDHTKGWAHIATSAGMPRFGKSAVQTMQNSVRPRSDRSDRFATIELGQVTEDTWRQNQILTPGIFCLCKYEVPAH